MDKLLDHDSSLSHVGDEKVQPRFGWAGDIVWSGRWGTFSVRTSWAETAPSTAWPAPAPRPARRAALQLSAAPPRAVAGRGAGAAVHPRA
jgi:hypothetical protein